MKIKEFDPKGRILRAYDFLKRKKGVWLMAETGLSNKGRRYRKAFSGDITFLRIIRFVFALSLSILMVYIYYLHLKGNLQKTLLELWTNHQKAMISLSIFIFYSALIFRMGVWRGRKR
jgi:hypothetical protein